MTAQIPNQYEAIKSRDEKKFLDDIKKWYPDDNDAQVRWIRYSFGVNLEEAKKILSFMNWIARKHKS
ncbi:MAG: hypothetical protein V3V58_00225 [Nitrosopumilaceae archaeon]